jgi:hypothetical protein
VSTQKIKRTHFSFVLLPADMPPARGINIHTSPKSSLNTCHEIDKELVSKEYKMNREIGYLLLCKIQFSNRERIKQAEKTYSFKRKGRSSRKNISSS